MAAVQRFVHSTLASRVVFGAGSIARVAEEVRALGATRVFLIADTAAVEIGDRVASSLATLLASRWDEVVQHVPVPLAERARKAVDASSADAVVCVGGGSSTGLAKAIALSHRVPVVAVPTTYAGSEMTSIYGLTGGAHKQTGKDPMVAPRTVLYDPELTYGLPPGVTAPSAFNAIAHCVEALYGPGNNPVTSLLALEGIRSIAAALPIVIASPRDPGGRSDLLYGAHLAGVALAETGTALHHKACHVLGGMFGLVHGDMNSVVLPHAVAFNEPAVPDVIARVGSALGLSPGESVAAALFDLASSVGAPTSLAAIGMRADGIDAAAPRVVDEVMAAKGANPRPIDVAEATALLRAAFDGVRPR